MMTKSRDLNVTNFFYSFYSLTDEDTIDHP